MQIAFAELTKTIEEVFYEDSKSDECYPKICELHKLGVGKDSHNCLACNFADIVNSILSLSKVLDKFGDERTAKTTYLLWLYLLSERMQEIFKLISLPEEIKNETFKSFHNVKRWGNFIKHPKAFLLTHHAKYDDQGSDSVVVDDQFIKKFYSGDKNNVQLYQELSNSDKVVVNFPDLILLTRGIGQELQELFNIIKAHPIYLEILASKTILENYFGASAVDGNV